MSNRRYTVRDPEPLARTVVLWLYIHLGMSALSFLLNAWQFADYREWPSSGPADPPVTSDLPYVVGGLGFVAAFVVCGFLVLKWTYRVNRNAHAFTRGLDNSPPWSVAWYFVPIASLWKPYQALKQAWQANERPESWRTVQLPNLMPWWWALWLITNIIASVSWRLLRPETVGENMLSAGVEAVNAALQVPLDMIFIQIVRRLTAAQSAQILRGTLSGDDLRLQETRVQLEGP